MDKQYRLIIFDLNGTLTNTPFIDHEPLHLLRGRAEKLQMLEKQGIQLALASNQGGVAFGYQTPLQVAEELAGIWEQLGLSSKPRIYACYAHPKASYEEGREGTEWDAFFRKPMPGMLFQAMLDARATAPDTLMVGDLREDEQAARNAGATFSWASWFFREEDTQGEEIDPFLPDE